MREQVKTASDSTLSQEGPLSLGSLRKSRRLPRIVSAGLAGLALARVAFAQNTDDLASLNLNNNTPITDTDASFLDRLTAVKVAYAEEASAEGLAPTPYRVIFTPEKTSTPEEQDLYKKELTEVNNRLRAYDANFYKINPELAALWDEYKGNTVKRVIAETDSYKMNYQTSVLTSDKPYTVSDYDSVQAAPFNLVIRMDQETKPVIKVEIWAPAEAVKQPYNAPDQASPYFAIGATLLHAKMMQADMQQWIDSGLSPQEAFEKTKDPDYRKEGETSAKTRMSELYTQSLDRLPALGITPLQAA